MVIPIQSISKNDKFVFECKPNVSTPVTRLEEFDVVVRSELGTLSGRRLRLVCGAEVDAIYRDGRPVELKTQRLRLDDYFWVNKSMRWWLQSFLFGIDDMIVGYRDASGIVRKVESLRTSKLLEQGGFPANAYMNLLSSVLSKVKKLLADGDGCIIHYEINDGNITIRPVPNRQINFFTRRFRAHFN
ncbi:Dom-3 Z [Parelaphostrongylus tenuis]|uniref:Decapping nuclease n=1 Tax=Parelaphostrongylus tenuis TaxID=148309 RepID=A0AAD5RCC6_PARTN|nr:Dom-3 Z [Parelaphostrongylus tenuis]